MEFSPAKSPEIIFTHLHFSLAVFIQNQQLQRAEFWPAQPFFCSNNPFAQTVAAHLNHFFEHKKPLPILPMSDAHLNPFQKRLRSALCPIPFGQTLTYGELAQKLHSSAQAIGQGLKANCLPIFVPCHRVVAKNHLGGFHGGRENFFISIKKTLLNHEITH